MVLTVLPSTVSQSTPELIRLFHQSQLEWSRHLGEETQLDFGRWITNPALPDSTTANCLHDAYLLPGLSAIQLINDMEKKANAIGVPWRLCSLNPSMSADQSQSLADALTRSGWNPQPLKILHRRQVPARSTHSNPGLTIIPTRASERHHRQLLSARAQEIKGDRPLFFDPPACEPRQERGQTPLIPTGARQERGLSPLNSPGVLGMDRKRGLTPYLSSDFVEAELLHLDDAHLDSLLALRNGKAVGGIGVLTCGEVGTLRDWYVTPPDRNAGIGRLLLDRALEICNRAMLRHAMIGLPANAIPALSLAAHAGFEQVGSWIAFAR